MLNDLVKKICATARVTADDVLALRQAYYADGTISQSEAASLFTINDACERQDASWSVFFVEALTDFTVHQMDPHGYISEDNARWLVQLIGADGKVSNITELELLINSLEQARSAPDALSAYALDQVKQAVITGQGPLRSGKELKAGMVDEADVELLRRILYAYAGGDNVSITAAEAEVLFDINDATAGKDNHPAWADLFAKAIANHLMFKTNHVTVDRTAALRRGEWLNDNTPNIGNFISKMVGSLRNIYAAATLTETDQQKSRREAYRATLDESEKITASEGKWLVDRIDRDGTISDAERAALLFIKQEAVDVDPVLQLLLDKVA